MNKTVSFDRPMDYAQMMKWSDELSNTYPFLSHINLGKSFLGRDINCFVFGNGAKGVLYVGAHHAQEWITSQILMRFIEDLCVNYKNNIPYKGYKLSNVFDKCKIYIIPMLNPDGVDLAINGLKADNPLFERLLKQNNGNMVFSDWQSNARGVDLNHNYDAGWMQEKMLERQMGIFGGGPTRYGGEYPESEPETKALCDFVRKIKPQLVMAFHSQGEEIYYDFNGKIPKGGLEKAKVMSKVSGYLISEPEGIASFGGFKDWFIDKYSLPGYTIEIGKGKNPLPLNTFEQTYDKIKELLIITPII